MDSRQAVSTGLRDTPARTVNPTNYMSWSWSPSSSSSSSTTRTHAYIPSRKWPRTLQMMRYLPGVENAIVSVRFCVADSGKGAALAKRRRIARKDAFRKDVAGGTRNHLIVDERGRGDGGGNVVYNILQIDARLVHPRPMEAGNDEGHRGWNELFRPVQFLGPGDANLELLREDVVIWRTAGLRVVQTGAKRHRDDVGVFPFSLAFTVGPVRASARTETATADALRYGISELLSLVLDFQHLEARLVAQSPYRGVGRCFRMFSAGNSKTRATRVTAAVLLFQ